MSAVADSLKVYISADMEGVAGVVGREQLVPGGFEYETFRRLMTDEVNAAIEGVQSAGATEIVVSDSHGNGQNLIPEALPPDIQLVRAWPRPLGMMEGIDASFDAALFVGYHTSAGSQAGIAAHTVSSTLFSSVKINGIEMSEGGINALIAGHFDVPVVMISGDETAIAEVSDLLGQIEGAIVKWPISYSSCRTLLPEAAGSLIREKAATGVSRLREFKPYRMDGPLVLELAFKKAPAAELIAYLPNVERSGSHTVQFAGDAVEISMFIEMVCGYPAAAS